MRPHPKACNDPGSLKHAANTTAPEEAHMHACLTANCWLSCCLLCVQCELYRPLHLAALAGAAGVVQVLVYYGANTNARSRVRRAAPGGRGGGRGERTERGERRAPNRRVESLTRQERVSTLAGW